VWEVIQKCPALSKDLPFCPQLAWSCVQRSGFGWPRLGISHSIYIWAMLVIARQKHTRIPLLLALLVLQRGSLLLIAHPTQLRRFHSQ
jgi:hypothetical protein